MAKRPTTVSILATPNTSPSTLFGLYDVLSSVGIGWEENITGKSAEPQFDVRIVAAGREPFRCDGNVSVKPHCSIDDVDKSDIVVVASFVMPANVPPGTHDQRELDWLIRQESRGAIMAAACTGAVQLADAGLLTGLEATTHWAYHDLFQLYYPEVRWCPAKSLCVSGRDNQFVTSGGATFWHDLMLYLITRCRGMDHAAHTAKFWLISMRDQNQAPYAAMTQYILHDDGVVGECQDWLADHYAIPNPISGMVERSGLPSSTFARRFKRATGYRPMDYVHTLRTEEAKQMLEREADAVDQIGREVGYEDPASFRRIFKRKVGLTPSIYRRRFGRSRFEQFEQMQSSL